MKIHILSLLLLAATSCNFAPPKNTYSDSTSNDVIAEVETDDKEMNAAIELAKQTLYQFKNALQNQTARQGAFGLKVHFDLGGGMGEHIWLREVWMENNEYFGIVDNDNLQTTEVNYNDTIKVNPDHISDWMFVDQGKLVGGFTTRVLRKRMSPEERKEFDAGYGVIIED
ncbi:MAG: DUF2314 domain-containing protein [Bacteroidia bacterium]|jgi:uncharacterized protein YegJ (DUF2314 family)|nr:DUF2314 domain-containing protein [Bacteroidia bacterium]